MRLPHPRRSNRTRPGARAGQPHAPWLPALQAIAANSPFSLGRDTGWASHRSVEWARGGRASVPRPSSTKPATSASPDTWFAAAPCWTAG
ncbi:glutamate-cysteine ligase family protein [Streptomyces sp. NPDC056544]|uniref:glutamate-cysteine ligase family protein n=1 Tax=Streptomyces sp. NPDC056544 TaxID=3345863 RepID=UPI0036C4BCA4